jgi:nucleoside-diphosphate-sugar epimerase
VNKVQRIVLVTGGSGFIGSNLVDALIGCGFRVRIIDNFSTGKSAQLNPEAELVEADIRNIEEIKPAFAKVDCVFHAVYRACRFRLKSRLRLIWLMSWAR